MAVAASGRPWPLGAMAARGRPWPWPPVAARGRGRPWPRYNGPQWTHSERANVHNKFAPFQWPVIR